MARNRPLSRPKRWAAACAQLSNAAEDLKAAIEDELTAEERSERVEDALTAGGQAVDDLEDLRQEYQDWRDGLPENLDSSILAEKLDEVTGLDFFLNLRDGEGASNEELAEAAEDMQQMADEAEGMDLPLGFGRD